MSTDSLPPDGRGFGVRVIGPPGAWDFSLQVGRARVLSSNDGRIAQNVGSFGAEWYSWCRGGLYARPFNPASWASRGRG
jgi:hypothetical protein